MMISCSVKRVLTVCKLNRGVRCIWCFFHFEKVFHHQVGRKSKEKHELRLQNDSLLNFELSNSNNFSEICFPVSKIQFKLKDLLFATSLCELVSDWQWKQFHDKHNFFFNFYLPWCRPAAPTHVLAMEQWVSKKN